MLINKSIVFLFYLLFHTNSRLVGVFQFLRHGARVPIHFGSDVDKDFYPFQKGELTNLGLSLMLKKGAEMRRRYWKLLDEIEKDEKYLQIISTPYERTISSAKAFINGLSDILVPQLDTGILNNNDEKKKSAELFHKSINNFLQTDPNVISHPKNATMIHVIPLINRFIFSEICINGDDDIRKAKCGSDFSILNNTLLRLTKLEKEFPLMIKEYKSLLLENPVTFCSNSSNVASRFPSTIASTLESISYHHITDLDPELLLLTKVNRIRYFFANYNEQTSKKVGSFLLRLIKMFLLKMNRCNSKEKKTLNRKLNITRESEMNILESLVTCKKYVVFFCHDDTLNNVMRSIFDYTSLFQQLEENYSLRANNSQELLQQSIEFFSPGYGADFTIELHHFDDKDMSFYVKLLYNGKEMKDIPLKTSGMKTPKYTKNGITLESFLVALESRIDNRVDVEYPCNK